MGTGKEEGRVRKREVRGRGRREGGRESEGKGR